MATFNYDFVPGTTVFVLVDSSCVREGVVLQVSFDTYIDSSEQVQSATEYLIKLSIDGTTVILDPSDVFADVTSAKAAMIV